MGRESAKGSLTAAIDSRSTDGGSCAGWSDPRGRGCQTAQRVSSCWRRICPGNREEEVVQGVWSAAMTSTTEHRRPERRERGTIRAHMGAMTASGLHLSRGGHTPLFSNILFSIFCSSESKNKKNRKQKYQRKGGGGGQPGGRKIKVGVIDFRRSSCVRWCSPTSSTCSERVLRARSTPVARRVRR